MAEFKLDRFKYTWRSGWITATAYKRDDIIRYGGKVYVCLVAHTSSASFYTDLSSKWTLMAEGYVFRGAWAGTTLYNVGDLIVYGGRIYVVTNSYTSTSTFEDNLDDLAIYFININWRADWTQNTRYALDDVVRYLGKVYRCTEGHTSDTNANGIEADIDKWSVYYENIEYRGEWTDGTKYSLNDIVKYGGTLLRVTTAHTADTTIESSNFQTEFPGYKFDGEWSALAEYSIGDVVRSGGYLFYAIRNNQNSLPNLSTYQPPTNPDWIILEKGIRWRGDWDATFVYKTGDVVARGGGLYVVLIDSEISDDGSTVDTSTLDYADTSNWELLVPGESYLGPWDIYSFPIQVGDVVTFRGTLWKATQGHFTSVENQPGDNGNGIDYWDVMIEGNANGALNLPGDLLSFDLSRAYLGDLSTQTTSAIRVGTFDQVLQTENNLPEWRSLRPALRNRYVSVDGVDDITDPERGKLETKPWRTIKYACEQVENEEIPDLGIDDTVQTKINVFTGTYEETLPIIIPRATAVFGDDKRSTVVKPAPAVAALANDASYTISTLNRFGGIISSIIIGTPITVTPGNTVEQNRDLASTQTQADRLINMIDSIVTYIDFHINSNGTAPAVTGGNTASTDPDVQAAVLALTFNKEFLAAEGIAWVRENFPNYVFDSARCRRDTIAYIDAWIYDLRYGGNYKSIRAARYYRNAVLGSAGEDMFYVRDTVSIRNMTMDGLVGTLPAQPVGLETWRRPTGGAYISLDPGWGPNDQKAWIVRRSPYIQNCVTFGYGAYGAKVDGALHNGGNKSITANDFTQVISDGVGAYLLNNGRAELISVFTYYSQVGYFAENGGIIRSANGNNSYGHIGALAVGTDSSEVPTFGAVDGRTGEATVARAFAGEVNDEVLILEYTNAGLQYTEATFTVEGAGANLDLRAEDFRDDAVFEARIVSADGSTSEGGGGYILVSNNAQGGNQFTISLVSSDNNEPSTYIGARIVITSGEGTGQYGYIQNYVKATKLVTVYKESDDTPGWDHVIPGYPIRPTLTTSTVYRIEPRVTFTEPPYSAGQFTLPATRTWTCVGYGETSGTFTGVSGTEGTGTVDESIVPVTATFNVTKNGRSYTVSLNNPGAGYADEQTITLSGEDVGGRTPDNDITITVKSITDDSTNSIVTFEHTGEAGSGKFIAISTDANETAWSYDGTSWVVGDNMPSSGAWASIAGGKVAGNSTIFVAVKTGSNKAASSVDGISWTDRDMPVSADWIDVAYGDGVFVAIASDQNAGAVSTNGVNWTTSDLPSFGDSSSNEWVSITYGQGKFLAIANSNNIAAYGTYNPISGVVAWTGVIMDVVADSSSKDWRAVTYGNNRYVAISSTGDVAYSFDAVLWYPATMPTQDGSTSLFWKDIKYAQGVFFAVGDTGGRITAGDPIAVPTTFAAQSNDGILWTVRTMSTSGNWNRLAFGNPRLQEGDSSKAYNQGTWVAIQSGSSSVGNKIFTGTRAKGRAIVTTGRVVELRLWDPGSGYLELDPPTLTLTDPNNTSEVGFEVRIGDGVIAQPSFVNRGIGYRTSSTNVTINGDGYADSYTVGNFLTITDLPRVPDLGAQIRFPGNSTVYSLATIEEDFVAADGTTTVRIRIKPALLIRDNISHRLTVDIRERYSSLRMTGHDFLDVGTGNFVETNYPAIYNTGSFVSLPENEVVEVDGGRVFYTSTDQIGNFRCGELFAVEQSTAIVTISSDFFDLEGLSELALGGIRVGGSAVVIREFSTDPLFTADSNNIVPTQRAIAAYLENRLTIGGSELSTASFIAGVIKVGPNEIDTTTGEYIILRKRMNFTESVSGGYLARIMFYDSFNDDPQKS